MSGKPDDELPLFDELKQLGEEARVYAEAEVIYQKRRVLAVGQAVKKIALFGVAALIIAVFALVALVAGLLMGLSSLVGPWWATAIVAGGFVLVALGAVAAAKSQFRRMMLRITRTVDQP